MDKSDLILTLALDTKASPRTVRRWLESESSVSRAYARALETSAEKLQLTEQVHELRLTRRDGRDSNAP